MPTRTIAQRLGGRAEWAMRGFRGEVLALRGSWVGRRHRPKPRDGAGDTPLRDLVRVVVSSRITDDDRLRLLRVVSGRLGEGLRSDPPAVSVRDASPPEWGPQSRAQWESIGIPVDHEMVPESQLEGFLAHASEASEPFLALQFDDTLTAGLSPRYLRAAAAVLERWEGVVDIVCPIWALSARTDEVRRAVLVTSHREQRGWYRFKASRPRRAIAVDVVDGLRFGIFVNPSYGFFFNHMIVPVIDYRRRLEWYASNIGGSVHAIEVAARDHAFGPSWRHVAICLDDVSLVDLDYAHTSAAVRPEHPELRDIVDRLESGWDVVVEADRR